MTAAGMWKAVVHAKAKAENRITVTAPSGHELLEKVRAIVAQEEAAKEQAKTPEARA
ncbi:MAG: hypothetical protein L0Y64_14980 [Myxococcaceae bacterium]|nr:hypothetical protein [Myxococcaceae bacterium]